MDYADIDRLPAILYFRKRVLKGEVIGFKQNELVRFYYTALLCVLIGYLGFEERRSPSKNTDVP